MLDTVLLVGLAAHYNRATGRKYPLRQPSMTSRHATGDVDPERRLGLSGDDLAAVLDRYNLIQRARGDAALRQDSFA